MLNHVWVPYILPSFVCRISTQQVNQYFFYAKSDTEGMSLEVALEKWPKKFRVRVKPVDAPACVHIKQTQHNSYNAFPPWPGNVVTLPKYSEFSTTKHVSLNKWNVSINQSINTSQAAPTNNAYLVYSNLEKKKKVKHRSRSSTRNRTRISKHLQ